MPRVCLYTAIYGGYDTLKPVPLQTVACDFICFSDRPIPRNSNWRVIVAPRPELHARMQAKFFKILSHRVFPGGRLSWRYDRLAAVLGRRARYDFLIWLDGSVEVLAPHFVEELLAHIGQSGWTMFAHPDRDCIYDEAEILLTMPKFSGLPVREQVEFYRSEGHPPHYGLAAAGVIARRANDRRLLRINEDWWRENLRWSYRDQLSLPAVLRRLGYSYDPIKMNQWQNPWLRVAPHNSDL